MKKFATQILLIGIILLLTDANIFAQTRIHFRQGKNAASVSGKLAPGAKRTFVLSASAGQDLTADINSGSARFGDGGTSLNYTTEAGNNYIYISNKGKRAANFTLTVSIR